METGKEEERDKDRGAKWGNRGRGLTEQEWWRVSWTDNKGRTLELMGGGEYGREIATNQGKEGGRV